MSLWLIAAAMIAMALAILVGSGLHAGSALPSSRWSLLGIAAALPTITVGLYLYLGAPDILKEQALIQAQSQYDTEGMVTALENKLKSTSNDAEGWYTLGRAYVALERYPDAEEALRRAATQAPKSAKILAQYAEAIALRSGSLIGRPGELLMEALDIDYEEEKALELAGLAAFQQEKWAESLHFWRRLLKKLPKDTEQYDAISQAIKVAESKVGVASGLGDRARLSPPAPKPIPPEH
jgi:cytochrome c-type biogenesis protein CcmH